MLRFRLVRSSFFVFSVYWLMALAVPPASATFPGKNGKIVFVANPGGSWQLYTINPDGSDMTQITNLTRTASEFWTPQLFSGWKEDSVQLRPNQF